MKKTRFDLDENGNPRGEHGDFIKIRPVKFENFEERNGISFVDAILGYHPKGCKCRGCSERLIGH